MHRLSRWHTLRALLEDAACEWTSTFSAASILSLQRRGPKLRDAGLLASRCTVQGEQIDGGKPSVMASVR